MTLKIHTESNFSDVDSVGIALAQYQGQQNHIAILFQSADEEDEVLLLHVGDHKNSLLEKPSKKYIWLDLGSDFHPIRKQVILASIQQIAEANKYSEIRYGLDHGVYCLDAETGSLNDSYDHSIGFTCATFVIEVFLAVGIKLIEWDTWPSGEEKHIEFQKLVFNYLMQLHRQDPNRVTLKYLKEQQNNIGKSRFLPQEVAAATQSIKPSSKEDIELTAIEANGKLTTYTKALHSS